MNFSKKNHEHRINNSSSVSKALKIKLVMLCMAITTIGLAQKRVEKLSETLNVPKDVTIDLNTSHVNIEVETWNKNTLEVEAYVESSELSKEDLKKAAEAWDLEVEAWENFASIKSSNTSGGLWSHQGVLSSDYTDALVDLKLRLADLPEIPEMPAFPAMPNMPDLPEMPEMPELPDFPELPELPEGVTSVSFDYQAYKKGGEEYLEKWSQEYEDKYGKEYKEKMKAWAKEFAKSDFDSYSSRMEEWGHKYGDRFDGDWAKKMEKWGEEFGKSFEGEWAEKMEKWGEEFGESFGKDMEKWGEKFGENFGKEMEKWGEQIANDVESRDSRNEAQRKRSEERFAERENLSEERKKALLERNKERLKQLEERQSNMLSRFDNKGNQKVKKTIKIKMPKDAELKVNVRHGKLKFASLIKNLKADLSYSDLLATSIDGGNTSINAAYSTVFIKEWRDGELELDYVEDAIVQNVEKLFLNSNSSNIGIDYLKDNAIINGSFGELTIHNIMDSFTNLNIILENSDANIKLPKTDYDLLFRGSRSKFNDERTDKKVIKNYPENSSSSKTIVVNAKYSNVVMQ